MTNMEIGGGSAGDKTRASVEHVLKGKYDSDYFITKAERDLARLVGAGDLFRFTDALIDFASTINHLLEWHWYSKLRYTEQWRERDVKDFLKWVLLQSGEVAAFIDLSNVFKHFERYKENRIAQNVELRPDFEGKIIDPAIQADCFMWPIGEDGKSVRVLPVLWTLTDKDPFRLLHVAKGAFEFWKTLIQAK